MKPSARWMATLGVAGTLVGGGAVLADVLVRDCDFPETLSDRTERGPRREALRGMLGFGNYRFETGQGLVLADGGVSDQYAVEVTFRFEKVDGWQDFEDRSSDLGRYVYNGSLQFHPFSSGGEFRAGETRGGSGTAPRNGWAAASMTPRSSTSTIRRATPCSRTGRPSSSWTTWLPGPKSPRAR